MEGLYRYVLRLFVYRICVKIGDFVLRSTYSISSSLFIQLTHTSSYTDAAINSGELELARSLYRRLLKITSHPRVFISFAEFENTVAGDVSASRAIFNEAYEAAIEAGEDGREMRVLIAEAWYNFEQERVCSWIGTLIFFVLFLSLKKCLTNFLVLVHLQVNEEDEYTQGTNEPFLRIAESKLPIERIEKVRYLYKGGARVPPPPILQSDGTYKEWEPEGEEAYIEYVFPEEKKVRFLLEQLLLNDSFTYCPFIFSLTETTWTAYSLTKGKNVESFCPNWGRCCTRCF